MMVCAFIDKLPVPVVVGDVHESLSMKRSPTYEKRDNNRSYRM